MLAYSLEDSLLKGKVEVKQLFDFIDKNAKLMDAYEMELGIYQWIQKIGLAAMQGYFAKKGTGDIGDVLDLDGIVLKKENTLRTRDYFSVFGKFPVPRTCYRKQGHTGVMPLDAEANLPERTYSYLLQEWMNILGIHDSFSEASTTVKKLLCLEISPSRIEVVNGESATGYDEFYEKKELPLSDTEGEIAVVGFDGKGVPVIKSEAAKIKARAGKGEKRQKKKEAIVGVSYTIDPKKRTAVEVAENLIYPEKGQEKAKCMKDKEAPVHAQNVRRMASLERSKEEVMEEIIQDARNRQTDGKGPLVAVMDGALGLWSLLTTLLVGVNWVGILDIIHVSEYLWKVANAIHGEMTKEGKEWVYTHLVSILQGGVGRVIDGLKQMLSKEGLKMSQKKELSDAITYFENHRDWMRYDEYLKAGYPIGSGVVESTCGHTVKNRMEGIGRRWSIKGAESTLLLRSIYTSKDWEAYWHSHQMQEHQRIYAEILPKLGQSDDYHAKMAA